MVSGKTIFVVIIILKSLEHHWFLEDETLFLLSKRSIGGIKKEPMKQNSSSQRFINKKN